MTCPGCGWDHLGTDRLTEQLWRLDVGTEHAAHLTNTVIAVLTLRTNGSHPIVKAEAERGLRHYLGLARHFTADPKSTR